MTLRAWLSSWTNGTQEVEVSNGSAPGLFNVRWPDGQQAEVSSGWLGDRLEREREEETNEW